MWKKALAGFGLLGLIVLLDPSPTPAQPPGGKGGGKGGFERPSGTSGGQPGAFPPGGMGGGKGGFERPTGGSPGGGMGGNQPGGGKGGFRMDPEDGWRRLQGMTGSTGDSVDLSKVPPATQAMLKGWAERSGGLPLPDSGIMTKAGYFDHMARSEAARADFNARGGAAAAPMGGAPVGMGDRNSMGGMGGDRNRMGGGGPGGGMGDPAEMAVQRMRELDRNNDGKISLDEADNRLRDRFREIDRNGDGFIETEEYTNYYRERFGGGGPGGGRDGQGDPNDPYRRGYEKKDTEEERPVALRYGKLPKDLPGWYDELDTDKDGQVALYEWLKNKREMKEFQEMDLNTDGLVTADEYLRYARQKNIQTKVDAYVESDGAVRPDKWGVGASDGKDTKSGTRPGMGGPNGGKGERPGSDSRPSSDSKPSDKGDKGDKSERKNPWGKK